MLRSALLVFAHVALLVIGHVALTVALRRHLARSHPERAWPESVARDVLMLAHTAILISIAPVGGLYQVILGYISGRLRTRHERNPLDRNNVSAHTSMLSGTGTGGELP